jgi:hypothetical protein
MSFKVVCIKDFIIPPEYEHCLPEGKPIIGEIYTVLQSYNSYPTGRLAYVIAEKPVINCHKLGWNASKFVPLNYYQAEFEVKEEQEA